MSSAQPQLVVLAINRNVLIVPLGQLGNGFLDRLHSTLFTHGLGRVVGVATSTIPVTLQGLGMERHLDVELFRNTNEEESGHPEMITHLDTLAGTDLELPLRGHDFGVDTTDVDTGIKACTVVCFDQVTGKDLASA